MVTDRSSPGYRRSMKPWPMWDRRGAVWGRLDLGDVVPWNVARSLEVRSGGQVAGVLRDARRNVRPDGSRAGIETIDRPELRHQSSDEPRGEAFAAWLSWTIEALSAR